MKSGRNAARPLAGAFVALVAALVCAGPAAAQLPADCSVPLTCPVATINDATVTEGNSGTTTATFTISLLTPATGGESVDWTTSDGSATTADSDYEAAAGTVTFDAGDLEKTVTVPVNGDVKVEGDETFTVDLSNAQGIEVADGQGQGTITNDDTALSIDDQTVTEGNSGTVTATFTVTRSGDVSGQSTVHYATADGTATSGSDYTATSGDLTFLAGETSKTIDVSVNGDAAVEADETFNVNLSSPSGAAVTDAQGVGTITNDDAALATDDQTVTEGNSGTTAATFTVTRSGDTSGTATVHYATQNGSARAPSDYAAASGTLTFNPGETTKTVTVNVNGDTAVEPDETFTVNLSTPTGATLADSQGIGTITNDDAALAVNDQTVTEGNSGTTPATFTVTRSGDTSGTASVHYATADGSGNAGSDYAATSGNLTFNPGETAKTVTVDVNGDTAIEPDETFTVNLSGAAGATIADSQGIGTITNDETGLAINDQSVAEGNSGTTPATFTVTRSGATTGTTTVHYATADGSANAGSDYAATSGDLTFLAGETTRTIAVNVNGDTGVEPDETFKVNLSGAAGAALTDPQGTGTITNDDVAAPPKQETPANPLPILPALDKTAPGVSKLSLSNTRFRVGKTATAVAASAKVGTAFRYALTEPATVTIIIDSAKLGQTVRKSCVAPKKGRHAKRCTRYSFIGAITRRSGAGLNVVPFSGRIGTKALKPGNYRARLIATDGANNRSPISAKTFTVVAK